MKKEKNPFVHANGSIIAHCPVCRGVVLKIDHGSAKKNAEKKGAVINLRCPHCYQSVDVTFSDDPEGRTHVGVLAR